MLIDKGTYWLDDEAKVETVIMKDGNVAYYFCPRIPKALFEHRYYTNTGNEISDHETTMVDRCDK